MDSSKGSSGQGEYLFEYRLQSVPEGVRVNLTGDVHGLTGIKWLSFRMFVGTYKKSCAKNLTALKLYLERGANKD